MTSGIVVVDSSLPEGMHGAGDHGELHSSSSVTTERRNPLMRPTKSTHPQSLADSFPVADARLSPARRMSSMPFLRESLLHIKPTNESSPPSKGTFSYNISSFLEYLGYLSILCVSSRFLDVSTNEGRGLMGAIFMCCLILAIADYYFCPSRKLNQAEKLIETFIWPLVFSILYFLAGASLETKFGLFNELVIIYLCLLITLTAFLMAMRKNSMSLAVIAVLSGMAMPFIVEDAYETPYAVAYSAAIVWGAVSLYLFHGWSTLFLVAWMSFWGAMHFHNLLALSRRDTEIIRGAVLLQWMLFWVASMVRERFGNNISFLSRSQERRARRRERRKEKSEAPLTEEQLLEKQARKAARETFHQRKTIWLNLFILVGCTHLLASTYYNIAYWAPWAICQGLLYCAAAACSALWERNHPIKKGQLSLVYVNYSVGVVLLSVGIWLGLMGDLKHLALAIEACMITLVSFYTQDIKGMASGLGLWMYILIWSSSVMVTTEPLTNPIVNRDALIQIPIIAMMAAQSHYVRFTPLKLAFEGLVHALLNMWLYREFSHSDSYLYFTTSLYPAVVQFYAYMKNDSSPVTFVRMVFGDILWLWLFISQTLPRLLYLDTGKSWMPLVSLVGAMDLFVVGLALHSSVMQGTRLQGRTRWIYIIFVNTTLITLIYRDSIHYNVGVAVTMAYLVGMGCLGVSLSSKFVSMTALLTALFLILDDLAFSTQVNALWKGLLALFAGLVSLIVLILPWERIRDSNESPRNTSLLHRAHTSADILSRATKSAMPTQVAVTAPKNPSSLSTSHSAISRRVPEKRSPRKLALPHQRAKSEKIH